ncbi:hypothetical protein BV20DRAFT_946216 [Pilatotrama ljubarskyi]|nr:hypothetical protein BV20DRAFT_946216 [Pilatotrama ljubarskyi]
MHWLYSGSSMKTPGELNRLVHDIFLAPEYRREHINDFNANRENDRLDKHGETPNTFAPEDGWRVGSVKIRLPKERHRHASEEDAPVLEVSEVYYRSLLSVFKAACEDASAKAFHWMPFKLFHRPKPGTPADPPSPAERLYGDAYTSDAMIEENEKIQAKARDDREPGDAPDTEYVPIPCMFASDSTHLTNFGTAALWPIYVFFANLSKYIRACPSSFSAHHLAYIPSLPLTIQTVYQEVYGEPASAAVLRFCKRELMQQIWFLLLDDDFVKAYVHGILVQCGDGITRRIFPRILTYSADYPEKCLIACIKFLARCPCPECHVTKDKIHLIGTTADMRTRRTRTRKDNHQLRVDIEAARRNIFQFGAPPEGTTVEGILGATSTTPTRSAFSTCLAEFGFNVYEMLVPDLLHEFELGVWKATMMHLVRILIAAGGRCVQEMDERFSKVPTFGRDTIRRLGANVSGFKKLAARDYEDLLQCAWPVFEGLLPPRYNKIILDMIFVLATWHALAKLRLHSESTLRVLEQTTTALGQVLRAFARDVCVNYHTKELPKETVARFRRTNAQAARSGQPAVPDSAQQSSGLGKGKKTSGQPKLKAFNLGTYKLHRLGDYPASIRKAGTTDNYTTQTSELEHRRVKRFYARTNKNSCFAWQIARHQRREQLLNKMHRQLPGATQKPRRMNSSRASKSMGVKERLLRRRALNLDFKTSEPLPFGSPKEHTQISEEQAHPIDISDYLLENSDDPAFEDFYQKLQVHVFKRLSEARSGERHDHEVTRADLRLLRIARNRMYLHKVLRVNYTSYDMRREQDSINPRSHADILMLAPAGEAHPYLYARVISIFHVNALLLHPNAEAEEPEPELVHVLWVRWYELDTSIPAGLSARRPYRLRFAGLDDEPFSFIAPSQVLRSVHIMPAPHYGRTNAALPFPSITRGESCEDDDYTFYYVGMWSDRDLFMRFLGGGIGHQQRDGSMPTVHVTQPATVDQPAMDMDHDVEGDSEPASGTWAEDVDPEDMAEVHAEADAMEAPLEEPDAEDSYDVDEAPYLGPEDGEGDFTDDFEYAGFASL